MRLLTKEIENEAQRIGRQEEVVDPIVIAKFFDPMGSWTWYATEYDVEDKIFFGYVVGSEKEWGSFSLEELESIGQNRILGIERDIHFEPGPFSEVVPAYHKEA